MLRLPKTLKSNKGFTLVELLVVIAIIGILAGALFVAINPGSRIQQANQSAAKNAVTGYANNIETYTATTGQGVYPDMSGSPAGSGATGVKTVVGSFPTAGSYTYTYTPLTSAGGSGCTGTPSTGTCAKFSFYVDLSTTSRFIYDSSKGTTCTVANNSDTVCP